MKLFKFFITVAIVSTLSSTMLDAAKRKQEHDFEPNKKTRTSEAKVSVDEINAHMLPENERQIILAARKKGIQQNLSGLDDKHPQPSNDDKKEDKYERDDKEEKKEKVDIDTALIKQEQKEQRELALPHTLLPYIVISKIDKRILPDDILYTIFEFLNPRDEKEFHQLLARLARSSGKAGFEQLEKIRINGFCLPPSSSLKNITLPEILKNKAPETSIRLLLGHCNNYLLEDDFPKLADVYFLAVEHKNLDPKIVDELKNKFLDALKDEKNDYRQSSVQVAFIITATSGYLPAIQELIQNPSTKALLSDYEVGLALRQAASNGHCSIVQFLIQRPSTKALLSAFNVDLALQLAGSDGHHAIVQTFIKEPALQASFNENTLYKIMKKYAKTDIIHLTIKNILDQRYSTKSLLQRIKYRLGL